MKAIRILILGVCIALGVDVLAQQTPQYTQYVLNNFVVNPGVAGTKECIDMRIGYRTQWVGFDAAPKTAFASVHTKLPNKARHLKNFHAIGAKVESDDTGPSSRTIVNLAYAYHLPLTAKVKMGAGIFAGFQQYRFDASKVTLINYNDPAITGSNSVLVVPDITPGVWLYSENYYAGLSIRQIVGNKISDIGPESKLTRHYVATAGKKFSSKSGSGISYIPSALVKFSPIAPPAIDVTLMMDVKNKFAVGAAYRNVDAIAGLFRVRFLGYFSLGYSFDFTTSQLRASSSNTHEIILGISGCSRGSGSIGDTCPAYY